MTTTTTGKGCKVGAGNRGSLAYLGLASVFVFSLCFLLPGIFFTVITISHQEMATKWSLPQQNMDAEKITEYPTVAHGDSGESFVESIPFQILSWKPRVLYFPNFATAEQCKSIIEMARSQLKPSLVIVKPRVDTEAKVESYRNSSGTFIEASDDETGTLDQIEKKIAKATMIPVTHGEPFNVLRYEIGELYGAHYDAFNHAKIDMFQRIATFLLYLSNVEEGGETMFPFENGVNIYSYHNYRKCNGLRVKPRRGDGLLFYSLFPNRTIDPMSFHGSCPVIKGEKWVATKWMGVQESRARKSKRLHNRKNNTKKLYSFSK